MHRVTWDTSRGFRSSLTRLSRSVATFSIVLSSFSISHIKVPQPREDKSSRFRLFRFRSPLLTESLSFSFPGVTEMFHFTPSCFAGLSIHPVDTGRLIPVGCPIRRSTDQSLLAASRGLSQLATSFFASWHQGIHRLHLVA